MLVEDSKEIGVFDGDYGVLRGVITCTSLITFIRYNANIHGSGRRNGLHDLSQFEEDNDESVMSRTEQETRAAIVKMLA